MCRHSDSARIESQKITSQIWSEKMRGVSPPIRTWCVSIPPWKIIMFSHVFPMKMMILIHFEGSRHQTNPLGDFLSAPISFPAIPAIPATRGSSCGRTLSRPRHCLVQYIEFSGMAIKILDDHCMIIGWSSYDHWMIKTILSQFSENHVRRNGERTFFVQVSMGFFGLFLA